MSTPYLQLNNLNKKFGKFVALNDINLTVNKGELVCFLGPSGCGKTTLLRIIAGLEKQTSGVIIQGDKNISFASPADRNYGIVFQSYALFPNLTIADNVAYGLVNRKHTKESIKKSVAELLQVVGLPDSGSKYPSQMSGGQQQRIALARALAASPDLLLLDEPLSALDATVRQHLRNEICSLQKQLGLTTIMVTHDQEEALSMADRVVVMNHGTIEQVGSPMEVYSNPASPFVADFIGKVNCLDAVVGDGNSFKCGDLTLQIPHQQHLNNGDKVKLYIRPEDTIIEPSLMNENNNCTGKVKHIEFFGSNCIAELSVENLANQSIQLQLSVNQMHDLKIKQGEALTFTVRPERIMVFPR